ncbi:MAG: MBL fold metallo-hydrolase [Clostridiales bacterium]|nr:MBL fold metallo-hydrolase [Clostridiales bacterium]
MKITYLGHSCFKFEKDGFALIVDPYKAGSVPGYAPLKETANQVLSTHRHGDHFGLDEVKLAVTRVDIPFDISFIESFHDEEDGAARGCNNVIIVKADGLTVVHMGDIGCELSDEDIDIIKGCDVLLIPVGGTYTVDAKGAKAYVDRICPAITVPMHYRGEGFGYDELGTVDEFTKLFEQVESIGSEFVLEGKPEGHKVIVMRGKKANV